MLEEIVVTGSRIHRDPLNEVAPMMKLSNEYIDNTGLTNLGAVLQQLPVMGSAINTRFNVPGNSGFPTDGNGIGAGAVQISLRNLGAKRTLVLVDGRRWIAGASASGIPSVVDINTIPENVIERIEILQDGASAIYGSDAIGGVINIITRQNYQGLKVDAQYGEFMSENDGTTGKVGLLWGAGNDNTEIVVSASYVDEGEVWTADRAQSAYPSPFATDCLAGGCSTFIPQARVMLGPNFDFWNGVLNDGVLNDGMDNIPQWDPSTPDAGDYHTFTNADRFNFNGPGFNYLQTPNNRVNLYANVVHNLTDSVRFSFKGSYTHRESRTQGAPEPFYLGDGSGNPITENMFISALNPYNPFGVDLSVANGNLTFIGRRPLESGPRIFDQDVDTYQFTVALDGDFGNNRTWYWDLFATYAENRGFQQKQGAHDGSKMQIALGDPAICAQVPGCVPFNLFGGQGPDGEGSITEEMLDFVGYTQRDFSQQTLKNVGGNITSNLYDMPAGSLGFAAGFEYREHEGSFQPDEIAASGNTLGIPSGPTEGEFDVTEIYAEVIVPLLSGRTGARYLEVNAAARSSDYSSVGRESTYKIGTLWQPLESLSLRGSFSTGIRAPGIGELFGGGAREDFQFVDPCSDVLGQAGAANNGHDSPQPANIIANCATLGVPVNFVQPNPQLSARSIGNEDLEAETSENYSFGFVYSSSFDQNWIEGLTVSMDWYDLEIEDAVQGRSPGAVLDLCAETLDSVACGNIDRGASGVVNIVNNQLINIGSIEASGMDFALNYIAPDSGIGQCNVRIMATYLDEYVETVVNSDGSVTSTDYAGTITDQTFQRAFPEWRMNSQVGWRLGRWDAGVNFRWVDDLLQPSGDVLKSRFYTDLHASFSTVANHEEGWRFTLGINNVFEEDPSVCLNTCGSTNMSAVVHDLPGRFGYFRVSFLHN
jgi:iron complex outermembrane receptor protein